MAVLQDHPLVVARAPRGQALTLIRRKLNRSLNEEEQQLFAANEHTSKLAAANKPELEVALKTLQAKQDEDDKEIAKAADSARQAAAEQALLAEMGAAQSKYGQATDEELAKLVATVRSDMDQLQAKLGQIAVEQSRRRRIKKLTALLGVVSTVDRVLLDQVISAGNVPSNTKVNDVGAR